MASGDVSRKFPFFFLLNVCAQYAYPLIGSTRPGPSQKLFFGLAVSSERKSVGLWAAFAEVSCYDG